MGTMQLLEKCLKGLKCLKGEKTRDRQPITSKELACLHCALRPQFKADFQSSHEAPRSSLRVMHEHIHPITMLNSSF
jgi:hypothetical protein